MALHQAVLPRRVWTHQYPGAHYLDLNAGEIDVDATTVTARVLDQRGGVVLERTWRLEELGAAGACAPHRGTPARLDVYLGFAAVWFVLLAGALLPFAFLGLALGLGRIPKRKDLLPRSLSGLFASQGASPPP